MKKLFTTLLLLLGAVLVTNAQTLKVGSRVIDLTKDGTYTGIGTNNGTATYKASSKTLSLTNIVLENETIIGTDLSGSTYTISLESSLSIVNSTGRCIQFRNSKVVINGKGHRLDLDGSSYKESGLSTFGVEGSKIEFWNICLYVSGSGSHAFYGSSSNSTLHFIRTYGTISSDSPASAFNGFNSITFDDGLMLNPYNNGIKFVSGKGVVDDNGKLLDMVALRPYLRVGEDMVRTETDEEAKHDWSWDKETKTLTIKDATLERSSSFENILENYGVNDLIVKFQGTNQLTSSQGVIRTSKNMSITGDGANTTNLNMKGAYGINYATDAKLTINSISVTIDAQSYGISGGYGSKSNLEINNSALTVKIKAGYAIGGISLCTMTDCDVDTSLSPDVCFRNSLEGFGTPSGRCKELYINTLSSADKYLLYVLGHQVNKLNKSNIAVDGLTEGTISFDNSTKVLTLTNVDLESPEGNTQPGIDCRISGIQIKLVGSNTVTTDGTAFDVYFNGDFNGSGGLTAVSKSANGLDFTGSNMTISVNNTVRFKGKVYGCVANYVSGKQFTLKKADAQSDYYFSGEEQALRVYYDLVLTDMDFYYSSNYGTPGCYFDKSQHCVVQNGGTPVSGNNEVNFYNINSAHPRYDLYVGGTQVTGCNKYGIGSMYITAGGPTAVTYNGSTKTLTLTDATVTNKGEEMNALKNSGVDGLTIKVVGDNTLMTECSGYNSSNTSVFLQNNTTITGDGTLNIKGYGPLMMSGKKLTIKDAKKVVAEKSIRAQNTTNEAELVVDNSNVESSYVCFWKSVTWLNGSLAEPVNGKFDPESTYIVDANGNKASRVVFIDQAATAIDAVEVDNNADIRSIYDANGRQMDSARKGLNIIRMSDGTVRKVMVK